MPNIDFIQLSDIDKRLNLTKTPMHKTVSTRLKRAIGYKKLASQTSEEPKEYIKNAADIAARLRK